jgi:hypothetical protein
MRRPAQDQFYTCGGGNLPANAAACSIPASCSYPTGFCYCDGATWSCS